jgi:hypothetical protein
LVVTILLARGLFEERGRVHGGLRLVWASDVLEADGRGPFDALEVELAEGLEVLEDGVELRL